MQSLRLITPAVSLGGVDTLIQQPAALTHRYVDASALEEHGVDRSLLRLSVGVESPNDLLADLNRALEIALKDSGAERLNGKRPATTRDPNRIDGARNCEVSRADFLDAWWFSHRSAALEPSFDKTWKVHDMKRVD